MKLIKPSFEIYEQGPGLDGIYEAIERAGRTCYKSKRPEGQTAKDFVDRMIASQHCYTGSSEVLTERGWVPWHSYSGEKVAVVDRDSSQFIGFEFPTRVISHEYTGNFYYYPSLGLEVTDGHRMYGLFRESRNNFYNSSYYDVFVCGQSYKDNNGREKTLGERMFKSPKHCPKPIYTNPFYELIGFWLGDGCYQKDTINKLVFHLKKDRKIEYLINLCNELGYKFEIGKGNYYKVVRDGIGELVNSQFYYNGKYIPMMYKADDPIAVNSIIKGLINSDGSVGVNTKTVTFTSTSYSIIDWINSVAPIGGYTASFRGICHETPVHNPVYKILLLDTDYTINNDSRNPDSKVRITNKTERVYCVTVSTGLIIVRGDNGVTSICGNCAMLEHGTVYLKVPNSVVDEGFQFGTNWSILCLNPYTKYTSDGDYYYYTTNYRVIIEHGLQGVLEYLCEPTEYHEKRITVRFTTDRGVSHEFVRHRVFSFAQESTRYCNYSKDKFGNELTFIIPNWVNTHCPNKEQEGPSVPDMEWSSAMLNAEASYMNLLKMGWTPQQARTVLPNSLKTELVVTGFVSDWKKFFRLRSRIAETGKPHPQAQELADSLMDEFVKRGLI